MRAVAAQRKSKTRRVTNPDETPRRPSPPHSGLVQLVLDKARPAKLLGLARLNPIQAAVAGKIARTDGFSTYESHTSYILRYGPHIFHRTR